MGLPAPPTANDPVQGAPTLSDVRVPDPWCESVYPGHSRGSVHGPRAPTGASTSEPPLPERHGLEVETGKESLVPPALREEPLRHPQTPHPGLIQPELPGRSGHPRCPSVKTLYPRSSGSLTKGSWLRRTPRDDPHSCHPWTSSTPVGPPSLTLGLSLIRSTSFDTSPLRS